MFPHEAVEREKKFYAQLFGYDVNSSFRLLERHMENESLKDGRKSIRDPGYDDVE